MGRPVVPIRQLDRRLPELGRIKDGVKVAGKGQPKAIDTLRFTSQDPVALGQVAAALGGEVVPYSDPKSTDTHELITPVAECPVILPPDPLGGTPMYELYSGGGRERWCDGITCEQWRKGPDGPEPYEVACPCAEAGELSCRPTVHLSVILPFTRLGGTWRWTTHSYNAAVELPGMVEAIQAMQAKGLTRGVLRVDSRTQRLAGVTRNFKVPVLGVDATADELASGQATLGAGSASPVSSVEGGAARQALPSGSAGGPPAGNDGTGGEAADTQAAPGAVENATGGEGAPHESDGEGHSTLEPPTPSGGSDDDVVDAEIVDDGDTLELLRRAMAEASPPWSEGKTLRRAREIAKSEVGLEKLPPSFDDLAGPGFEQVVALLAAELVEAAK